MNLIKSSSLFLTLTLSLLLPFAVLFLASELLGPNVAYGDDVSVTATVGQSVTCSTNPSSTDFGTLTTGAISTADSNATSTLSCNTSAGCTLNVEDDGDSSNPGLWNSADSHLIDSQTETLSAGSEGYGIQAATTTAGSGGELTIAATYDKAGDDVGGLQTSATTLSSSSEPISSRETVVTHKAAISATTDEGSYSDTITYSCTAN